MTLADKPKNIVDFSLLSYTFTEKNNGWLWIWKKTNAPFTGVFYYHSYIYYCKNGLYHREDGPAIINNDKEYWLNGFKLESEIIVKIQKIQKISFFKG